MSSADDPPDDRVLVDRLPDLPRELQPPSGLEERLVAELRSRGAVGSPGGGARRPAGAWRAASWHIAASALLAFALGLWFGPQLAGKEGERRVSDDGKRYLLLLYEPRPIDRRGLDLVAEYSAWAGELRRSGRLVAAEKLSKQGRRWGTTSEPAASEEQSPDERGEPTGFFLIRASGIEEAERIARDCPHLRHGGEVSLRPVDPT